MIRPSWRILALLIWALSGNAGQTGGRAIRVGVISSVSPEGARVYGWNLVEYLREVVPGQTFTVVPFTSNNAAADAAARGELEFLYVTAAVFTRLEVQRVATPIATARVEVAPGAPCRYIGGVIFCRGGNTAIQRLADLRGKRVVGYNPTALGGWLAAAREFKDEGLIASRDFADLRFARSPSDTAESVLDGTADVGVLSVTEFTRLTASARYGPDQFRVLPPRLPYPELQMVPARCSTRPYPGTPFIRMSHVPDDLAEEVAVALYKMPPPSGPQRFMNVVGWSLPMNYQPVHDCLRALGMPPYDRIEKETLSRIIERNWRTILLIVSIIAAILAGSTVLAVIARQRLAQSRKVLAQQASLLEQTSDAVFAVDSDYRITYWNRAAHQLRGLSADEVLGRRSDEVLPWPGRGDGLEPARRKFEAQSCWQEQIKLRGPTGSLREVELAATAIHRAGGEFAGAVVGLRDITERRNLEEQLRQSQKMQAVGLLAGGVAHDFNNLLTVINGYAEMAVTTARARGETAPHLNQILSAGRRAAELTQQLLAFSRKQILQPRAINLNALLSDMAELLRRLIGEDIELAIDLAPELSMVQADPGQVQQVVLNLVVNARDATPPGGIIRLFTSNVEPAEVPRELRDGPVNRFVMLTVADTGAGMEESVRQRIFEPFFTTKELGKGTGLGLSTVYGIVQQSGGHIEVSSAPGEGAWFHVYLPAVEASNASAQTVQTPAPAPGSECALVVEDQVEVRAFACEVLRGAGYRVIEAESPRHALDLVRDGKLGIDVLLTDVVMPDMSGPELAHTLRAGRPAMRVLFMSGYAEDQVALRRSLGEGTAFIEKPFSVRDLELKVRALLDGIEPA